MADWKSFLIAVDDTETSMRAARYAGELFGCVRGTGFLLLHVYPEPPPDYYRQGGTFKGYADEREARARGIFENALRILNERGVPEEAVSVKTVMAEGKTISQAIIEEQKAGGHGTVILGKRGLSKAEEFLFGSISSALLHHTSGCAVIAVG